MREREREREREKKREKVRRNTRVHTHTHRYTEGVCMCVCVVETEREREILFTPFSPTYLGARLGVLDSHFSANAGRRAAHNDALALERLEVQLGCQQQHGHYHNDRRKQQVPEEAHFVEMIDD